MAVSFCTISNKYDMAYLFRRISDNIHNGVATILVQNFVKSWAEKAAKYCPEDKAAIIEKANKFIEQICDDTAKAEDEFLQHKLEI